MSRIKDTAKGVGCSGLGLLETATLQLNAGGVRRFKPHDSTFNFETALKSQEPGMGAKRIQELKLGAKENVKCAEAIYKTSMVTAPGPTALWYTLKH
jgi:hypothetical protein